MLAFWKWCHTCIWSCSPWSWWTSPCPCSHCPPALGLFYDIFDIPGCWHFENGATHVSDYVHHDPDGLLHVLVLTVHLLLVLFITNLTSLDAGILKMVPHMYLIMFTMILMDFSMSLFSLSTCSGSFLWHIWHPWMLAFWKWCHTCIWLCSPWSWWTPPCPCSHCPPALGAQDALLGLLYEIYSFLTLSRLSVA